MKTHVAIASLVAGIAVFSVQDLILKLLSDRYPLSEAMVLRSIAAIPCLLVLVRLLDGGFGEKIARYYGDSDMRVLNYGVRKEFADRYAIGELLEKNRLTDAQIVEDIRFLLH